MDIALIYGGKTGEHEVSLVSATSVARNLSPEKNNINLISISKKGEWFLQPETELTRILTDKEATLSASPTNKKVCILPAGGTSKGLFSISKEGQISPINTDIVFPILHGTYGEDGLIQGLFEMAELPYCGCDVMSSALSMDKEKTKQIWKNAGLPIVPFITIRKRDKDDATLFDLIITKSENEFGYPVFVKPCKAGSSVGANKATNKDELLKAIDEALLWDEKILIESFIKAREVECSVTGFRKIETYTLGEIAPTHEFYDYEAKYTDPNGAALQIPAKLDEELTHKIKEMAKIAFKELDAIGFSRIDFFVDKESDKIYLNEINTIPGFTSISMFPKMCEASGLKYPDLLQMLINLGIERFNATRNLKTSR